MKLDGARVLITGAGGGLGRSLAQRFSAAGADLVLSGRHAGPLQALAESLPRARALPCDVTDEDQVEALFAAAGPVNVVIANAGASASAPLGRTSLADWNAMLAVNLTGTFLTFRAGLNQMKGPGRLIAIASTAGLKGYGYVAPYAAAKHGVVGLVRSLAAELSRKPITCNALCPGFLDTEMTDRSVANIIAKTGRSEAEARAALAATNPQGRLVQPDEVSEAALWLCSPASDSIRGQAIAIAGGEL